MKLRQDIPISDPNPSQLKAAIEEQLDQLIGLGLQVELIDPATRDRYDSTCVNIIGSERGQDDNLVILEALCEPLSAVHLASLVQLGEQTSFDRGVIGLKYRMARLGYYANYDGACKGMLGVHINETTTQYFSRDCDGLAELQLFVEESELRQEISQHTGDFLKAGIQVNIVGEHEFEIILQENDPALKRRLTRKNVDRLITLAYVWNDL